MDVVVRGRNVEVPDHYRQHGTDKTARLERYGHPIGLLAVDIDHFKQINDRFGHEAGDAVLKDLAALLESCIRDVDVAARFGGGLALRAGGGGGPGRGRGGPPVPPRRPEPADQDQHTRKLPQQLQNVRVDRKRLQVHHARQKLPVQHAKRQRQSLHQLHPASDPSGGAETRESPLLEGP